MKKCLAFVLGGGGARGALQVGALRALLEAGLKPDLLVGTSIGAVNAAGLALWGVNAVGLDRLEQTWKDAAEVNFMDPRLLRLSLRIMLGRPNVRASQQITEFLTSKGLTPDYRFEQIAEVRLALVSADLISGQTVVYGQNPRQSILEGILASTALPPFFAPVEKDDRYIIDGGLLSNLPIETALSMGATDIIALSLDNLNMSSHNGNWFNQSQYYVDQLIFALHQRHASLETALAEKQGVPVHHIELKSPTVTPIWDFSTHDQLIRTGYAITSQHLASQISATPARYIRE